MRHISISDSELMKDAFTFFKSNFVLLLGLVIVSWATSFIGKYIAFLAIHTQGIPYLILYVVIGIAVAVLSFLVQFEYWSVGLQISEGKKPRIDDVFNRPKLFWKFVITSMILGVVLGVCFVLPLAIAFVSSFFLHQSPYFALLFITYLPLLYVVVTFCFTHLVLIDKNVGVWKAFKESARITKHNKMSIFGSLSGVAVLNMFGAILFGIGLLLTIPITILYITLLYKKFA